jgi:hypothetical protein
MTSQARRSGALLVSVYVDPEASPRWFARLSSYRDAFAPAAPVSTEFSVDDVCASLRAWLISVVEDQNPTREGTATIK